MSEPSRRYNRRLHVERDVYQVVNVKPIKLTRFVSNYNLTARAATVTPAGCRRRRFSKVQNVKVRDEMIINFTATHVFSTHHHSLHNVRQNTILLVLYLFFQWRMCSWALRRQSCGMFNLFFFYPIFFRTHVQNVVPKIESLFLCSIFYWESEPLSVLFELGCSIILKIYNNDILYKRKQFLWIFIYNTDVQVGII